MVKGPLGGWSRAVLAAAAVLLAVVPVGRVAAAAADTGASAGDPVLSIDPAAVLRSMVCRGPADGGGREPVLLVHGTFITAAENFGWNYLPELAARGYRVCTVNLPNRSIDDIQVAAETVVVAVHRLARETGHKVDILAHSQGALQARWAVRWWPSVRAEVDDLVSMAGPNQGTTVAASPLTPVAGCSSCLQMAPGSAFLTALNRGDQSPGEVSYTALYSTLVDELIMPNATAARIEGASNLELQALCPARVVTHATILVDAVAFALMVDAFGRPGPATAGRFNRAACGQTTYVGGPALQGGLGVLLTPQPLPVGGAIPTVEPPLKAYAMPGRARTAASPAVAATTAGSARVVTPAPARGPVAAPAAVESPPDSATATASAPAKPVGEPAAPTMTTAGSPRTPSLPLLAGVLLAAVAGAAGGFTARRTRLRSPSGR